MTAALVQKIEDGQATSAARRNQGWRVALSRVPKFRSSNIRGGGPVDVPADWTRRKQWVPGTVDFATAEAMFRAVEQRAVVTVASQAALAASAVDFLARAQAGASNSSYIGYAQAERRHATAGAAAAAAAEARAAMAQAAAAAALPAAVALPAAAVMPAAEVEAAGAAAGSGHGVGSYDDPVLC